MKKSIIAVLALSTITLVSWKTLGTNVAHDEAVFTLDATKTTLAWTGKYVSDGHTHIGTVNVTEGSIKYHASQFESGSFNIDMKTIDVKDLPAEKKPMLLGHLQSADFFNVGENANVKVKINSMTDKEINATLTVLGKDIPAIMPVSFTKTKETLTATGKFDVDFAALGANGFKAGEGKPAGQHTSSVISFDLNLVMKK